MTARILVDISHHGYGHLAQIAPVLKALHACRPDLKIIVRSSLPGEVVKTRIALACDIAPRALDLGMSMDSAIDVLPETTLAAHLDLHRNWSERIRREATAMRAVKPALVLSDIPYLSAAAAHAADIPSLGLSSLNWADVFWHYCGSLPGAGPVHEEMMRAYGKLEAFIQCTPHMPMDWLPNRRSIGPVASLGRIRRDEVLQRLRISPGTRLGLLALGGIETRVPIDAWPRHDNMQWIVPLAWNIERDDCHAIESLGMPFSDALASADLVITKPGYGTFVEAACLGLPVLTVQRRDWPETEFLLDWLHRSAVAQEISRDDLTQGAFMDRVDRLLGTPAPPPVEPTGNREAAELIAARLEKA